MKKYLLFICLLLLVAGPAFAQSPLWSWAHLWAGSAHDESTGIAIDEEGNSYTVGNFSSPVLSSAAGSTLSNSGATHDIFLIKYAPSGTLIWTKKFGHASNIDEVADVFYRAGKLYITGISQSTSLTLGITTLSNPGSIVGVFTASLDTSGNVLWAKNSVYWATTGVTIPVAVTADADGNVIATGHFTCPAIAFGTDTLNCNTVYQGDVYLVKYDASGNVLWAKRYGNADFEFARDVTTDKWNNICLIGSFNSPTLTFGTYTLVTTTSSPQRFFAVKTDPDANVIWAYTADGHAQFNAATSDSAGNFAFAGFLVDTLHIAGNTIIGDNAGQPNVLVLKCDAAGSFMWASCTGGNNGDAATNITSDASGSVYITGSYFGIGAGPVFGDSVLTNPENGANIFVAKYTSSGTALWGMHVKNKKYTNDEAFGIAVDGPGTNIYISGRTRSDTLRFGNINAVPHIDTLHYNAFIAKISSPPTAVNGLSEFDHIYIYPNPATNVLIITGQNVASITITNMAGSNVLSQIATGKTTAINISGLAPGAYLVAINTANGRVMERLIKR